MITKEQVRAYYQDHFKILDLVTVINMQEEDFDRREFAWAQFPDVNGGKFRRNVRFDTVESFREGIVKAAPYKLYFGAVYKEKWNKSIIGTPWNRNELHFDIDINESELSRHKVCDCGTGAKDEKKRVCDKCFEIVKEAAIFLIDTLHEDFGIDRAGAMVYFSGTRGLHVHYPKVQNLGFDEEDDKSIRRHLIEYISLVNESEKKDEEGKKSIMASIDGLIGARSLVNRASRFVYKWFFLNSPESIVKKARMSDAARKVIVDGLRIGIGINEILDNYAMKAQVPLMTARQITNMREMALSYRYPRYDGTPTYDVRKVIKVPLSVDCNTGYIVTKIRDLEAFTLGNIDRIENHVKDNE